MCGIAGFIGESRPGLLKKMLAAQAHRGPDGQGMYLSPTVSLGHNRLAIIDLSDQGNQPMWNTAHTVALVFNGEIYNFVELRRRLSRKYHFTSHTDSEVILHGYEEWGTKLLSHLDGMFSFVIYDRTRHLLFGARDRLGEKPLVYAQTPGLFAFASEVRGLLPALPHRRLDYSALDHFLTLQYVPTPSTGFVGVHKLPPATYFLYSGGKLSLHRYWQLDYTPDLKTTIPEWEEIILSQLEQSVANKLLSDVPLGFFLSGGLDSGTVVALAARHISQPLKTFTVTFPGSSLDESRSASQVARLYSTRHTEIPITPEELIAEFPRLADYYAQPLADNSILPTLLLARQARSSITVALGGDGGDENFAGYDRYRFLLSASKLSHLSWPLPALTAALSQRVYRAIPSRLTHRADLFTASLSHPLPDRLISFRCFFTPQEKQALYGPTMKTAVANQNTFQLYRPLARPGLSDLTNAIAIDNLTYLPDDLLYKSDMATMASGLELRSPFLDYRLMEITAHIPETLKVTHSKLKYIYRRTLKHHHLLPDSLFHQPKRGFVIPLDSWFKGPLRDFIIDSVLDSHFTSSGLFNRQALNQLLASYFSGTAVSPNNIFALIALSAWLQRYS